MTAEAQASNNMPKILVGCPTCDLKADSLERFFQGLMGLTYSNVDILLEDNSPTPAYAQKLRELGKKWEVTHPNHTFRVIESGQVSPKARARLVHGRNAIRDVALKENYDYFFSLEQDVVPPTNIIERLLETKKEIVSGAYLNQDTKNYPEPRIVMMAGIYENEDDRKKKIVRSMGLMRLFPSRVMDVAYTGLGCILISRNVLDKIRFRYDEKNLACDDIYFCMDAQDNGFAVHLDSSALCAHHFNDAFTKTEF